MEHSGARSSRRARHRPMQSCEIVGILPAEEAAITRALYASLLEQEAGHTNNPENHPSTSSSAILVEKTSVETIKKETTFVVDEEMVEEEVDTVTLLACSRLSSPELSEENEGTSNTNFSNHPSASGSCPSSPQSGNSLHLFLSSSSSSWSSSDTSSCDSLFLPWSSNSESKSSKRRNFKASRQKSSNGSVKSKRTLKFSRTAKLLNGDGVEEKDGREEVPTARKSASNAACAGDVVTAAGGGEKRLRRDKDSPPHQGLAQRKFATNHTPPVRFSLGDVKPVTGLKQPPKTEDFITYLNLRGSNKIPKRLKKFDSPWTPLRRKRKSTKCKSKAPKTYEK